MKTMKQEKKIKEYLNKWEKIPCSRIGKLNTVEIMLPKLSYRFNIIPTRTPADFFVETDKLFLKFLRNNKGPTKAKSTIKKI